MCFPFECNLCILNFNTRFERNIHIKRHFKQKSCRNCDRSLIQIGDDWYELRLHVDKNCNISEKEDETHFEEKSIKIEETSEPFSEKWDLHGFEEETKQYIHSDYVPPLKIILTEEDSDYRFDVKNEIDESNDMIAIEPSLVSQKEKRVKTAINYKETEYDNTGFTHTSSKDIENKRLKCEFCHKTFALMGSLKRHLKKGSHQIETFRCELCSAVFDLRDDYIKHAKDVHEGKRHSCEFCGNTYKKRSSLKVHKSIHSQQDQVSCDICKKKFRHKEFLSRHMEIHRNHEKLKCEICSKEFSSLKSVKNHIQIVHEGKTLFKCEICDKGFASNGSLKLHIDTHSESRRYICSYCGKGFTQSRHLSEHINGHTGDKPNICTICNKGFTRRWLLHSHLRIHTGEKPYKCQIEGCERAYAYGIDLKRHQYSVHGIYTKKHVCPICSKVYPENKLLKKHLESHKAMDLQESIT